MLRIHYGNAVVECAIILVSKVGLGEKIVYICESIIPFAFSKGSINEGHDTTPTLSKVLRGIGGVEQDQLNDASAIIGIIKPVRKTMLFTEMYQSLEILHSNGMNKRIVEFSAPRMNFWRFQLISCV